MIRPVKVVESRKVIQSLFAEVPKVSPNPNRRAPLVAIVNVSATVPVIGELQISDAEHTWTLPASTSKSKIFQLIAYGMRPGRPHEIRIRLTDPETGVSELSDPLAFLTPQLPKSFPPVEVTLSRPEATEPGVLIFPVNLWKDDESMMNYGYLIGVDEEGEVVWFLDSGHRTADVRLLSNGHLLFQHGNYRYALEIDLLGNVVRQWHAANLTQAPHTRSIGVPVDTMHHEIVEAPNGHFFTLSTKLVKFEKFPTSVQDPEAPWVSADVVCDELVEFDPASGDIVRRWDLTNFLDRKRFGYLSRGSFWKPKYKHLTDGSSRDWSHANAFVLLPEENAVIVSFRHHDCLVKFDLRLEKIIWIFGTPDGWGKEWQQFLLKPVGENFSWPYHQHGPQVTATGHLRMYDNGNYRSRPFKKPLRASENHSRVVEFAIDESAKTVRQVWEYDGAPDDTFFCPFYCEADFLPQTGNYLITDGGHIELEDGTPFNTVPGERQWARIIEISGTSPHDKVFELRCESPLKSPYGWSIYRSMKLPSLSVLRVNQELLRDLDLPEEDDEDTTGKLLSAEEASPSK